MPCRVSDAFPWSANLSVDSHLIGEGSVSEPAQSTTHNSIGNSDREALGHYSRRLTWTRSRLHRAVPADQEIGREGNGAGWLAEQAALVKR
jgi:hypothetical protein